MVSMKEILYGSNDKEPHTETVAQLAQELYNSGLLITLVENLQLIDFEVVMHRATVVAVTPQLMVTLHLFHRGFQHCKPSVCVFFSQGKKDVCQIFNNILRRQIGTRSPTVEYFCSHQEVLFILLNG